MEQQKQEIARNEDNFSLQPSEPPMGAFHSFREIPTLKSLDTVSRASLICPRTTAPSLSRRGNRRISSATLMKGGFVAHPERNPVKKDNMKRLGKGKYVKRLSYAESYRWQACSFWPPPNSALSQLNLRRPAFPSQSESPEFWKLVDRKSQLTRWPGDFGFHRGPVWDDSGFLYVSDEEKNKIYRVYLDGRKLDRQKEELVSLGDPDGQHLRSQPPAHRLRQRSSRHYRLDA